VNERVTQELKVMKVKEVAGSKCFILTLNKSDNALPEAVLKATPPVSFSLRGFLFLYASLVHFLRSYFICVADANPQVEKVHVSFFCVEG